MKSGNYIGVMSGTSLDGVDVVLATINESDVVQQAAYTHALPPRLKKDILSLCQGQPTSLSTIGKLDAQLGVLFAEAVLTMLQRNNICPGEIIAIGCHGQTVWHEPQGELKFSIQLGDNNRIAALTQITTVGDFRRRDMAYGGQGAPLVPAFHHAMLADSSERRIVLNIGGIANLSLLLPGFPVTGFDTGPGNILMDAWIECNHKKPYDQDANWAAQGRVNSALLQLMLSDRYFSQSVPKSTGREHFNINWLEQLLAKVPPTVPTDVQATLAELTAVTIVDQIKLAGGCERLLVCGGGARNPLVMSRLATLLPDSEVCTTDKFGISGDTMEALAFAWLAFRTLSGLPGNLPSVTGASCETLLGAIYPISPGCVEKEALLNI